MTIRMRKHIWPMSLVMSLAIIGALAAFVVLAATPVATQAHSGGDDHAAACDTMSEEGPRRSRCARGASERRRVL